MQIERVSVIGAGTMGAGIAQVFAAKGHVVKLIDVNAEFVKRGVSTIESSLDRMVKKETIPLTTKTEIMGRIRTDTTLEATGASQLVVEAVSEIVDLKKKIWREVASYVDGNAILATNTSSISISELAATVPSPNRFIGMHFMNPVPVMKLVEVIRGLETDDTTTTTTLDLCQRLPRLRVESHPDADDQRSRLLSDGRRRQQGSHRRCDEARHGAPDGTARTRRLDRPRRLPRHHGGPAPRPGRFKVPPVSIAAQNGRVGTTGKEDRSRILRLREGVSRRRS